MGDLISTMSKEDGFREATQEQRELYGEDNYASNTSLFRNTTQGSLRTTLEHMGELRDSIDEIEQRFTRLSRKSNITGMPPDESEQSKLRKTVRNTIRTISEVARSKSLSIHTDTIFRKELNRATTTMVGYLKNEQNEDMVLSGLDNLREVIDDSFQDKNAQKIIKRSSRLSQRVTTNQVRQSKMNRQTMMRQSMAKGANHDSRQTLVSDKVEKKDMNKVVDDFEDIRQIFDEITSKVAARDLQENSAEQEQNLRKSVKGALRNLQDITTHQHLKQVDGGFRTELAETTETMLDYLKDSADPSKVESMELQMLNVIDNIDNGTTEKEPTKTTERVAQEEPTTSNPRQTRTSRPPQEQQVTKARFKRAGQKIVKQVRAASIFKNAALAMNDDIVDERVVRKSVKHAMRLVKKVVDEETVVQFSEPFREELSKTAEGMIDFLTGRETSATKLDDKIQGTLSMLNEQELPTVHDVKGSNSTGHLLIDKLLSSEADGTDDQVTSSRQTPGPMPRMTYDGNAWMPAKNLQEELPQAAETVDPTQDPVSSSHSERETNQQVRESINPRQSSRDNQPVTRDSSKTRPLTHDKPSTSRTSTTTTTTASHRDSSRTQKSMTQQKSQLAESDTQKSTLRRSTTQTDSPLRKSSRTRKPSDADTFQQRKLSSDKSGVPRNTRSSNVSQNRPSRDRPSPPPPPPPFANGDELDQQVEDQQRLSKRQSTRVSSQNQNDDNEYNELNQSKSPLKQPSQEQLQQPIELGKRVSFSDMPSVTFLPANQSTDSDEKTPQQQHRTSIPEWTHNDKQHNMNRTSQTVNEVESKATETARAPNVQDNTTETAAAPSVQDNATETIRNTSNMATETQTKTETRATSAINIETRNQAISTDSTMPKATELPPKEEKVNAVTRSRVEKRASRRSRRRTRSSPPTSSSTASVSDAEEELKEPKAKRSRSVVKQATNRRDIEYIETVTSRCKSCDKVYESLMTEMLCLRQTISEVNERTTGISRQLDQVQAAGDVKSQLDLELESALRHSQMPEVPSTSKNKSEAVSSYLIQRNGVQKLIYRLDELTKNDLIICVTRQTGETVALEPHPELRDQQQRTRASSPTKIVGLATRDTKTNETGWASSRSRVKKNHQVYGAATRTPMGDGDVVSGWLREMKTQRGNDDAEESPTGSELSVNESVNNRLRRRKRRA